MNETERALWLEIFREAFRIWGNATQASGQAREAVLAYRHAFDSDRND